MCLDPLTAALTAATSSGGGGLFSSLGSLFSVGSGVVGAYSSIQSGRAAQAAAEATARQQESAARESLRQGDDESERKRRAGAAVLAQQRVAMAANGIDVSSASAIEQLDDTKAAIEDDAFAIRQNFRNQAGNYSQMAANSRTEGANALSQGRWGAAGTILSTGAKVGEKYSQWARDRATPRYA